LAEEVPAGVDEGEVIRAKVLSFDRRPPSAHATFVATA
jgi:hypothetical protein